MSSGAGTEQEQRGQVDAALGGVDVPVVVGRASSGDDGRRPPRRLRPKPTVIRDERAPWWAKLFVVVFVLTDVLGTFFDFFFDLVTFRIRRRRTLRGGWRSEAGSLLAAAHAPVRQFFVVGRDSVHLVYVGELGSEVGWSMPRARISSAAESTKAGVKPPHGALGFHFADGSWCRLLIHDASWRQMLEQFPTPSR